MAFDKPYELGPNSGILNATKIKKNPKSPDYFGDLLIDQSIIELKNGLAKIRISGWKTKSASGNTYLSLKLDNWKPDSEKQPQSNNGDMDDDIPF